MNKKFKVVAGICTLVMGAFLANKYVAKADDNLEKIYFKLSENVTTIFNEINAGGQSMCIVDDTAYIARNDNKGTTYIDQINNINSGNIEYIKGEDKLHIGHANGMTYYNGDLFVASCTKKEITQDTILREDEKEFVTTLNGKKYVLDRNLYRLTKDSSGKYIYSTAYKLENNSNYYVTDEIYPKNIAYYKNVGNTPYFIVGIDTSEAGPEYLEYIIGYFRNADNTFKTTNYFKINRGKTDTIVNGVQDIDCKLVNGRYRLLSSYTMNLHDKDKTVFIAGSDWPSFTRNITYETDVDNISNKATLEPQKRFSMNSLHYEVYEIQSMKYADINGKIVPISLFHHKEKDTGNKFGALYTYDYQFD